MDKSDNNSIWTIGHSNFDIQLFIEQLLSFSINILVDVRKMPGSNKYPIYNKDTLEVELAVNGIKYISIPELGGRRKVKKESLHTVWKNKSFRAYADYMDENDFLLGISKLKNLASKERTCIMCAEAVWWRCHRSMISDYMKSIGWNVIHIMGINKSIIHPYTSAATIVNGKLEYGK